MTATLYIHQRIAFATMLYMLAVGLWGLLTFLLNFIPYLGSVIACTAPILLAFLQTETLARPAALALILVGIHTLSAYFLEPAMTGKAASGRRSSIALLAS